MSFVLWKFLLSKLNSLSPSAWSAVRGYAVFTLYSYSLIEVTPFKCVIVSPDESREYLGFSTVTPPSPPQRFPFGRDNLKNILVRPFKFGMWVYLWAIVL